MADEKDDEQETHLHDDHGHGSSRRDYKGWKRLLTGWVGYRGTFQGTESFVGQVTECVLSEL